MTESKTIARIRNIFLAEDWNGRYIAKAHFNLVGKFRPGEKLPYETRLFLTIDANKHLHCMLKGQLKKNDICKLVDLMKSTIKTRLNNSSTKLHIDEPEIVEALRRKSKHGGRE